MDTLTNEIINKIAELNALLTSAETNPSAVADLVTLKVDKPFNNKGRKVSIKGAIGSLKEHAKAITAAPKAEDVEAEDVIEEAEVIEEPDIVQDESEIGYVQCIKHEIAKKTGHTGAILLPNEYITMPTLDGVIEENHMWGCGIDITNDGYYKASFNPKRYRPYLAKQLSNVKTDRQYLKANCNGLDFIVSDLAKGDILVAGLHDQKKSRSERVEYYVVLSNKNNKLIVADKNLSTYAKAVAFKNEIGL